MTASLRGNRDTERKPGSADTPHGVRWRLPKETRWEERSKRFVTSASGNDRMAAKRPRCGDEHLDRIDPAPQPGPCVLLVSAMATTRWRWRFKRPKRC